MRFDRDLPDMHRQMEEMRFHGSRNLTWMYYLRDNCYVLPEELGRIFDEESVKFIGFQKSLLIERWKKVDDF